MLLLGLTWSQRLTEWLVAEPVWLAWLLCGAGVAALVWGADRTVDSAVRLARGLGMSTVIIGATVVSLGTTTPEMFTSVTAAFQKQSGLALGNAVGSIICDTGLIFGLGCLLSRLPLNRFVLNRHGWLQLSAGVLLAGICVGIAATTGTIGKFGPENAGTWNRIPRWIGGVLVVLLVAYMYVSARWARQRPEIAAGIVAAGIVAAGELPAPTERAGGVGGSLLVLVVGLAVVAGGSNLLIPSVSALAIRYGIPKDFLAVTLVAFSTSLPELATAIASILKGHKELLVGNIVGADILNVLFVVGLSATAEELSIPPTFYVLHFPMMLAVLILLRLHVSTSSGTFRRWQGVPMLALYVGYVAALVGFAPHLIGG